MSGTAPMPAPGDPGMTPDPSAGGDAGGDVVVTICSDGQGGYTVYAGSPPDDGGGADMSEDDDDAMGAGGAMAGGGDTGGGPLGGGGSAPASQGQPASSIGSALKQALDIMQADASSKGGPSAEDQFSSGFGAPPAAASGAGAKMKQKY